MNDPLKRLIYYVLCFVCFLVIFGSIAGVAMLIERLIRKSLSPAQLRLLHGIGGIGALVLMLVSMMWAAMLTAYLVHQYVPSLLAR